MRSSVFLAAVVLSVAACGSPLSRLPGCTEATCADGSVEKDVLDASQPDASQPDVPAIDSVDVVAPDTADVAAPEAPAPPDVAPVPDVAPDRAPLDAPDVVVRDVPAMDVVAPDLAVVDVRPDLVPVDVRPEVAPGPDAPTAGCLSGVAGTHVVRFRWTGSGGASSRASVSYEANTLPDRTRWRVSANSRSIGYNPVFTDIFLGEGGLDLSGTAFIDVELSTAGLGAVSSVSLAIYGRSFNTTASGSFAWRTFDGEGAAPSGLVANSAPYRWYRADVTTALPAGNPGVLLRITPGPPSGSLIVNRVEVCFNTR